VPSFWLDTDSLVRPSAEGYRFAILPRFWDFLEEKARQQVIVSSIYVLQELEARDKNPDELLVWARRQQGTLFLEPNEEVQETFRRIVDKVLNTPRYYPQHVHNFLGGADPWLIAHAKVAGGKVVTFEKPEPNSHRVKIPDVAREFGVLCTNIYDALSELGASF